MTQYKKTKHGERSKKTFGPGKKFGGRVSDAVKKHSSGKKSLGPRKNADGRHTEEKRTFHETERSKNEVFYKLIMSKLEMDGLKVSGNTEPLSDLPYLQELDIKNIAIHDYWKVYKLPGVPEKIIASPLPRHYRTTSKRRATYNKKGFFLTFTDTAEKEIKNSEIYSELEPEEHVKIYSFFDERLNSDKFVGVAKGLNYVIIRGSYTEFSIVFNMYTVNGDILRKLKMLCDEMQNLELNIKSAYIYHSPSKSEYFFDVTAPDVNVRLKKIFGPDMSLIELDSRKYSFHITSFSQVNESILPDMLKSIQAMVKPDANTRLFDLYCGYGLFSLYLKKHFREIYAADISKASINSAIVNAKYFKEGSVIRFFSENITPKTLEKIFAQIHESSQEKFILDPPRSGPDRGVIRCIAERAPQTVLHICCGIERVPEEIKEWQKNGYHLVKAQPLDMFPGTYNLETMLLFSRNAK